MKKHKRKIKQPAEKKPKPVFQIREDGKCDTGAPAKYRIEYDEKAYKLCLLGAVDKEIADFFDVDERTINDWKIAYPSFLQSMKNGKINADANVAESLYKRACGYEHDEDKIFQYEGEAIVVPTKKHYAPDTAAAFIWLKNRTGKLQNSWKDRSEIIQKTETDLSDLTDEELDEEIKKLET